MIGYESLGLALLHFVWQGLLVAVGLAILLRTLSTSVPEVRYGVGVLALVAVIAFPAVTLWDLERAHRSVPTVAAGIPASPGVEGEASGAVDGGAEAGEGSPASRDVGDPSALGSPEGSDAAGNVAARLTGVAASVRAEASQLVRPFLAWIVGFWVFGVLFFSTRLLGGWVHLRKLTRIEIARAPDSVHDVARALAERLGVRRAVRLLRSARIAVPAVVGWLRPVILLPASTLTGLSPAQLEAIIAHELAHVRRHDYVVNILQSVVETLLFYHPAVWWVSRRIREEREHCCDELAVAVCGDRRLYAGALLDLEILRAPPPLVLGAAGGSLVQRIRRLLELETPERDRVSRRATGLTVAVIALSVMLACGGSALVAPLAISDGQGLLDGQTRADTNQGPVGAVLDGAPGMCPAAPRLAWVTHWDGTFQGIRAYDRSEGDVVSEVSLEGADIIDVGPDCLLYVTSYSENRVRRYTADLSPVDVFADANLSHPTFMAFDSAGKLYVSNFVSNTISRYLPDGSPDGIFASVESPRDIAFDAPGNLYVARRYAGVDRYRPDGTFDRSFATAGLNWPVGLAFDSDGNLYVSNEFSKTIRKFSSSGADLGVFAVTGTGPLVDSAIKIDADGVLWLINNNGAVRRFRLADGTELPPAPAPWLERGGFGTAGVAVWNELPDPNRR